MKRILASLLAVMLVICASITAFGATSDDVNDIISAAVEYGFPYDGVQKTDTYSVDTSKYFLMYVKSGADAGDYEESYLDSVKSALDSGTLAGLGKLSMVLQVMYYLGVDATDFEGYDLVAMFAATDVGDIDYNPYYYAYAAEAASIYSLDDFGKSLCDALVGTYYTVGAGTDFWGGWGTSADDLSSFLIALAPYSDDYSEYVEDAKALLETYLADTGYGYGYGDANADSTAMALGAYSALGENEKAGEIYTLLIEHFRDSSTGGFTSDYDPYYATADAVYGLEYYAALLAADETEDVPDDEVQVTDDETQPADKAPVEQEGTDETTTEAVSETTTAADKDSSVADESTTQSGDTTTETTTAASSNSQAKSPSTGAAYFAPLSIMLLAGAGIAAVKRRK